MTSPVRPSASPLLCGVHGALDLAHRLAHESNHRKRLSNDHAATAAGNSTYLFPPLQSVADRCCNCYVYESSSAVFVKLTATVDIDQSVAKQGNIVVTVSGASTYSPSTLTVANYGTYAVTDKVLSTPTITAGMAGSTIGEFEILEGLPGSLIH